MSDFFPKEFTKCPLCGETETIANLACQKEKDEGRIEPDVFVSLSKEATPLMGNRPPIGLTISAVLVHYDICANCGHRRCTKVEIIKMPIVGPGPMKPGGGLPQKPQFSS